MRSDRALPGVVRRLAAEAGINPTAGDIAACTGIPKRTINRVLAGERVAAQTITDLAAELGTTRAALTGQADA